MGTQGRYFGRWLMPILPILCLLAALRAAAQALAPRRAGAGGAGAGAPLRRRGGLGCALRLRRAAVLAMRAQGLVYSVHSGLVLSRADTRTLTRDWMVAQHPARARRSSSSRSRRTSGRAKRPAHAGCRDGPATTAGASGPRCSPTSTPPAALDVAGHHEVGIENYVRTLSPALIGLYEQHGLLLGGHRLDRVGARVRRPAAVPQAIAYYRALARAGHSRLPRLALRARRAARSPFNFDWSFDYYPLAYDGPARR